MQTFNLVAGVASIVGLWFSLGAVIQASRASVAAQQARDAVLIRSLVDEFELACVKMDQLLDLLGHDRFPEAAMRANDLTSSLSEIPSRRSSFLSEDRQNALLDVRAQVQIIAQKASSAKAPVPPTTKDRLILKCRQSSVTLRENLGTIRGELDRGAKK